jgi:hypothetical protein
MVRGSGAPRSVYFQASPGVPPRTGESLTMDRNQHRGQPPLEVTVSFEPTRLAADHLMEAYRQAVPPQGLRGKTEAVSEGEAAPQTRVPASKSRRSSS